MALLFSGCNEQLTGCIKHSHDCYEIVVMHSGECATVMGDTAFALNPCSVLLIPPHTAHESFSGSSYGDYYLQVDTLPLTLTKPTLVQDFSLDILHITRILHRIYLRHDAHCSRVSQGLLNSVFVLLEDRIQEHFQFTLSAELKGILEKNIVNSNFSISSFADHAGYSADYVRRCFKSDIGMTPQAYLTRLRLEYAADLLKQSPIYNISEIALQCGYQDPYYFSRAFKKYFGRSPKRYRQI